MKSEPDSKKDREIIRLRKRIIRLEVKLMSERNATKAAWSEIKKMIKEKHSKPKPVNASQYKIPSFWDNFVRN